MTLGERIKTARKNNGMTQSELARLTGVSQTHISKVETNKDMPSKNLLKAISEIFGVDTKVFLNDNSDSYSPNTILSAINHNSLKFKTSNIIPHEDDMYYVFAPELDCMTNIKTQGGFAIANYKNGKWIHISKEKDFFYDSIVKSQDISQYVKAWIPFEVILSLLPLDIIQWYTAYMRNDNK